MSVELPQDDVELLLRCLYVIYDLGKVRRCDIFLRTRSNKINQGSTDKRNPTKERLKQYCLSKSHHDGKVN